MYPLFYSCSFSNDCVGAQNAFWTGVRHVMKHKLQYLVRPLHHSHFTAMLHPWRLGLSWSVCWASKKWLIPPASSLNYTSPGCISNTQIWDLSWSPHQALSKKVNEGISQDVRLSFNLVFQPLFQQSLPPPGCPVSSCMPQLCKFAHLISTLITHSSPPNPPFSCFLHISSFGSSSLIIWDTWCRVWHEPVWKQHGTPRGLSVVRIYQNMNYGSYENE